VDGGVCTDIPLAALPAFLPVAGASCSLAACTFRCNMLLVLVCCTVLLRELVAAALSRACDSLRAGSGARQVLKGL
jgi:hypothetical protein